MNIDEYAASRGITIDPDDTKTRQEKLLAEVRAFKLRQLRESLGLTQTQVAERIGVSQRQVSKIERGDLENSKIKTIRGYLNAVGADMSIYAEMGELHSKIA